MCCTSTFKRRTYLQYKGLHESSEVEENIVLKLSLCNVFQPSAMAYKVLAVSDSFGFVYPGKRSYKGLLKDAAWSHANAELKFLPVSGATFADLVGVLKGERLEECDAIVIACFGNEHFDSSHRIVSHGVKQSFHAIGQLLDILPLSKSHLIIYGGKGSMWLDHESQIALYDRRADHVRLCMAKHGFNVGSGFEELAAVDKGPGFHYPLRSSNALVQIWVNWIQEAISYQIVEV